VVIKSLGPLLTAAPFVAGASLVDDRVMLLIDLVAVTSAAAAGGHTATLVPREVRPAPRRGPGPGKRILIAEDSDTVREAIRRAFEARGFEVTVAVDGAEALRLAADQAFDAVSTDIVMPNVDGYELARRLRADPRHAAVPIVMLTSKDARIDQLRGIDAGADAYVTKPVDAGDLVRQVEALLARGRSPV
jgi:CheY-like chemotaxis protein